jgi:hypothetical protein
METRRTRRELVSVLSVVKTARTPMKARRSKPVDGHVAVRHAQARACSFDGCVFVCDETGVFWVPLEAVRALRDHGFVPVEEVVE